LYNTVDFITLTSFDDGYSTRAYKKKTSVNLILSFENTNIVIDIYIFIYIHVCVSIKYKSFFVPKRLYFSYFIRSRVCMYINLASSPSTINNNDHCSPTHTPIHTNIYFSLLLLLSLFFFNKIGNAVLSNSHRLDQKFKNLYFVCCVSHR